MERRDLQKRIEELEREKRNLQISISQLKENLSKRFDNLPQTEGNDFECRASHSVSELNENPGFLTKNLKISEMINKVVYINDEINLLDDDTCQYTASAVTGSVTFQVHCLVKDMKDKEMIVHSLKVKYLDRFHDAELKSFSTMCMRQNSMQTLIRGVVSYAELFAKREEFTNWLTEENEPHFSVTKHHENEAYYVTAKVEGSTTCYFSCEWKIKWNEGSLTMIHCFTFRANNETTFYEENEYLFRKMTSSGVTSEEVTDLWHRLAKAIITENELARQ